MRFQQDAGDPPLNSRSELPHFSSRDLYGTGSRLASIAYSLEKLAKRYAGHPTLGPSFSRSAAHYRSLVALETAGMGQKMGQCPPRSTVDSSPLFHELREQTRGGDR